ncbi:hypothetical protein LX36DRAFT_421299 [Colletotrichum falcatum]|nr:hypothetical protein LX36DRAFT_421299 [Colletotrichum falcatum]
MGCVCLCVQVPSPSPIAAAAAAAAAAAVSSASPYLHVRRLLSPGTDRHALVSIIILQRLLLNACHCRALSYLLLPILHPSSSPSFPHPTAPPPLLCALPRPPCLAWLSDVHGRASSTTLARVQTASCCPRPRHLAWPGPTSASRLEPWARSALSIDKACSILVCPRSTSSCILHSAALGELPLLHHISTYAAQQSTYFIQCSDLRAQLPVLPSGTDIL